MNSERYARVHGGGGEVDHGLRRVTEERDILGKPEKHTAPIRISGRQTKPISDQMLTKCLARRSA